MAAEDSLESGDLLAKAVGFAKRLLVVVGYGHEKRRDLDFVEAPKRIAETLLSEVKRTDVHDVCSSKLLHVPYRPVAAHPVDLPPERLPSGIPTLNPMLP